MNSSIQTIPLLNLLFAFIPLLFLLAVLCKWSLQAGNALYALARMVLQLLLVGYFLSYIFKSNNAALVILVLSIMLFSSSWIALRSVATQRRVLFRDAFLAICLGGLSTLLLITQVVLNFHPWYLPQYMIPLAGMIFAAAMNSVSLAAERFYAEQARGEDYVKARNTALQAALIPIINSLFAVGLVSLPGMMTGQILSGVAPFIAARYQIMVMCMMLSSAGISAVLFLRFLKPDHSMLD